jgi:hypothetical protein
VPVTILAFSSKVNFEVKALARESASCQPPAPVMLAIEIES